MKKIIISIGNALKSDDNIGNLIIERLQKEANIKANNDIMLIKAETTPENFIQPIINFNPDLLYIIDVVDFSDKTGDVKLFNYQDIQTLPITTTHNIPVTIYSKYVNKDKIKLIAIQPKSIEAGEELSAELKEKFDDVCRKVKSFLS